VNRPPETVVGATGRTTPPITLAAAGEALWGEGGRYAYAAYRRLRVHFPALPEELAIVVGLTAYGHCIGLTRGPWEYGARITLAPLVFRAGARMVDDVLTHEMLHAELMVQGKDPKHEGAEWYAGVRRLSPAILGHPLEGEPDVRKSVRIPNPNYGPEDRRRTLVRKIVVPGAFSHADIARWPVPFRPAGHDFGPPISVPTY
jgi:hypothetical protein